MKTFLSQQESLVARALYANDANVVLMAESTVFGEPLNATTGTAALTESASTLEASGTLKFTGTAAASESPNTLAASGALKFTGTAAVTGTASTLAATGTAGAIVEPVQEGGRVIAVRWKPLFEVKPKPPTPDAVSGAGSATATPATLSAQGTNTPPPIIGNAHFIALTPRMIAQGAFNTDELDTELATALLNL
jgi:hypothetical protein